MEEVNNFSRSIFTDIDVYIPHLSNKQEAAAFQVYVKPKNPSLRENTNKLADILFLMGPITGNPDNMVDKLISSNVNPMEEERILSFMQEMSTSKRNNLSGKELMDVLPSKYNSTLTDIDKVRDFFENKIYTSLEDESKQKDSSASGTETFESTDQLC